MTSSSSSSSVGTIEAYYHSALEACATASQLEADEHPTTALTEYRRAIQLIEGMRALATDPRDTDEAYFAGVDDVEGICRVHIAKIEGDLPATVVPREGQRRRKSNDSVNTLGRGALRREGSVPPRKEVTTPERSRRPRPERTKVSRSPSPEKKEKKSMPFSLRTQPPLLTRVTSADSALLPSSTSQQTNTNMSTAAAVEASRAATLAWQGKKPINGEPKRPLRNPSPTSSRAGSIDSTSMKRASIGDAASLLDAPLIDFSAPIMGTSAHPSQDLWMPLSPAPTPPPQPQPSSYVDSQPPRRKQHPPSKSLGRSNAHVRPIKPVRLAPPQQSRSASAPDLSEQLPVEVPPISVSISEDISPEEELSREEKVLKELKGVDEALARTIINEIVVKGDEVRWDDIGANARQSSWGL